MLPSIATLVMTWPLLVFTAALPQETQPAATAARDAQAQAASATGFLDRTLALDGQNYAYSIYVPADYTPTRAWPVILFLHGSGERGVDGLLQTEVGIGGAIRRHRDWFPAIVVMPQCRPNFTWIGPMAEMALKCVEHTSRDYHLEPQRIYLTGLSLGGQGAWQIGAAYPERFAAIVPVCGFVQDEAQLKLVAEKLAGKPVWAFHGDEDKAVPVDATRGIVQALRAAGGKPAYTEYPGVGHNSWDKAYGERELWKWLLEQRNAVKRW
jgi:predicted peptidase